MSRISTTLRAVPLLLGVVVMLPVQSDAQSRRADRDFGRSADAWCRDVRDGNDRRRESFCDVREETLNAALIDLDTGGNGSVRVRGSNRRDVRLRARVTAWADSEADARDLARDVRLDIRNGRIRVDGPSSRSREYWGVAFELEVPREIELMLATRNGSIGLADYSGKADVRTVNGGIALADVGGDIRGETMNGGIAVELEGRRWDGAGLDLQTRNGGVSMLVPEGYSAELETGTVNGGIDIDFPITIQGRLTRLNRHITTTLGSGGPRVRVQTTNGGVRIKRR